MELLIKKSAKILSFAEGNSAPFEIIVGQLGPLVHKIGSKKLLAALQTNQLFTVSTSNTAGSVSSPLIKLKDELTKQLNDESRLGLFFKEDKSNRSLYLLYRLILQAGSAGITYSDLAVQFNASISRQTDKEIKRLDITNVSHYCRKLFALKFIRILPEKICKLAIASKFADKGSDQIDIKAKRKYLQLNAEQSQDIDDKTKQQMQLSKLAIVSDPWNYLKEDTFILRELTFTQNILLNFASYEAYLREGLLQSEIASKIHKLGERKMLVRSLESIIKGYYVLQTADRQGRTFSLKFHIKSQKMADLIDHLLRDKQINLKAEIEELNNNHHNLMEEENIDHQRTTRSTQSQNKMECEEPMKAQQQQPQSQKQTLSQSQSQSQQFLTTPVNPAETLFSSNPRLNSESFNHIFSYFKDHPELISYLLREADKSFIESCFVQPPAQETADYTKFSELLLKVINENVEFDQVRSQQTNNDNNSQITKEPSKQLPSKKVSKKQISRNKLNRYIIILNRISEKKVLKSLHLKKYIILLEKHQGVGEIDKKTLEHILNTFQHIGYIQIIKKDIHIKTIKQNIVRAIIVHKDIPLSDPRVIRAERTIQNGLLKQGNKGNNENNDDEFSDYSDDSYSRETPLKSQAGNNNNMINGSIGNKKTKENSIGTRIQMDNKQLKSQKSTQQQQQTDITNFFLKKKRINVSSRPEVYYYDEEDEGKEDEDSFVDGEYYTTNNKKVKREAVKKEESSETNGQINLQVGSDGYKEIQLREALAKVNKANCEVSAKPRKLQIFLALLIQILHSKRKLLAEEAFGKLKMKEDYSQVYSQICFGQPKELKYPLFQANLCKNLLALSSSVSRPIQQHWELDLNNDMDIMHQEEQFSVEQLISDAFKDNQTIPSLEDQQHAAMLSQSSAGSSPERILEISNRQQAEIEQIKKKLNEMRGKEFKNVPAAQKENILKLKNYLLRNPSKTLAQLKIRFPVVHYFSFLSSCAYSGSMKFFILDKNLPVIKHSVDLKDINQDNLDEIYYQITPEYYSHFNLL